MAKILMILAQTIKISAMGDVVAVCGRRESFGRGGTGGVKVSINDGVPLMGDAGVDCTEASVASISRVSEC